jgi:uncharacterized protein (TIGR03435 family)
MAKSQNLDSDICQMRIESCAFRRFDRRSPVKKLTLWVITLAFLCAGALLAQVRDITGTWQGTLNAGGRSLRTVIKISKADDGSLKAVLYSIDQGGQPIGASAITLDGSTVKITIAAVGGAYEGNLNAGATSMEGTFTQGPASLPLHLDRATEDTAWTIPTPPPPLKPSDPDAQGRGFRVKGRQFSTINTSLMALITFAYGLQPKQVTGGPDWIDKDKYDLLAEPDGDGQPNEKQWRTMLKKLLADRFKLTFHHDKADLSVYALVVGKNGSKLAKSQGDPNGLPALFFGGVGILNVRNANMTDFSQVVETSILDRPVVDQTGLVGRFDFTLKWTPDEAQFAAMGFGAPSPVDSTTAPPDLFTAMQEQLGLKLESTKAPVDVLVIDHVEKPSAN